jgi:uncharacterized protein (TIGR02453 family)
MAAGRDRRLLLEFLRELRDNNDRGWFQANRARYEEDRAIYLGLVGELLGRFDPVDDLGGVPVADCAFRINRDIRFSKDKSPYKTGMGAVLGREGRRSTRRSYYFHIEPDGRSMLAGGLYEPSPAELGAILRALAEDSRPLKKIIRAPAFAGFFGGVEGDSLKTAPQGYPKDHPEIELLRMKQFLAVHRLSDDRILSEDLVPHTLSAYKAMKPFLAYIESAIASFSD